MRRFCQLRFSSVWCVACPDPPLGRGVVIFVPLRRCFLPLVLRPSSSRIGRSVRRLVLSCRGGVSSSVSSRRAFLFVIRRVIDFPHHCTHRFCQLDYPAGFSFVIARGRRIFIRHG